MQSTQQEDLSAHVNDIVRALEGRVDPEAVEDELRRYLEYGVPLQQARRDIVRNHGGRLTGGRRKLEALLAGDTRVDLVAKVLTVNPKEVSLGGEPKRIFYGYLADGTKRVSYTAWKDFNLQPGSFIEVSNAYVKEWRDVIDVNLGDYATVKPSDERFDVVDAPAGFRGGAGEPTTIRELRDGMGSVAVVARVLSIEEKKITGPNGERTLREGELADGTGRVPFTAWGAQPLAAGQVVRVQNAYVRSWRGAPQLNFGDNATVAEMPAETLPPVEALSGFATATLGDLAATGGATAVAVEGVVLEIKPGSGLIFRCTQCKRVLQNRMCRVHGRVEGQPDLRVKAVLDDGRGVLTFFLPREPTERLVGRTLEEAQNMAKEAMTTDVVQEEVARKLVARRLRVRGNVTSDEFGLQMIASDAQVTVPGDLRAEAERLLDEIQEVA